MENWAEEIKSILDEKLEGIKEKEIRFYRIDEFKRNTERVDSFSKSCAYCQKQKINISDISRKIDDAVNVPGKTRRTYDRLISSLSKHMQKEHGFYPPYYFSYMYSFLGIVIGLIAGYFLMKLFPHIRIEMFSIGFVAGLLPGYILGSVKDSKIRSGKKLM